MNFSNNASRSATTTSVTRLNAPRPAFNREAYQDLRASLDTAAESLHKSSAALRSFAAALESVA